MSYQFLFKQIEKHDLNNDNEAAHEVQDRIYRKFIKDIVNNKFKNMTELKKVANEMNNNVVKKDKGRWYA